MSDARKPAADDVSELSGNTYYPPPPPGPPPPSQNQAQDQHFPPPPSQYDGNTPSSYSIPAYNPADPVFAAPPTQPTTSGNYAQSTTPGQSNPVVSEQQALHQQHDAGTDCETKKSSSWGGRFKSMLSAGAAAPINSLAHKLGSRSFLPESLDRESDKAASILRDFCIKGVYADPSSGQPPTSTDSQAKESSSGLIDPTKEKPRARVIVTIPPKVISKAVGLAIFTTLRAGFQVSGATGSGILIARLPDGSWGPPSGISVHSLGGGFQIGLDIYDCVCVINSKEALSAFTKTRVSLGSDLAVAAGPYGAGGAVDFGTAIQRGRDNDTKKQTVGTQHVGPQQITDSEASNPEGRQSNSTLKPSSGGGSKRRSLSASAFKPVFSYVKSRGFYAGIQVDGTVVVERKDANSAFYGAPVAVQQILQGQLPPQGPKNMWPAGARALMETLKGADAGALADQRQQPQPQQDQVEAGTREPSAAMSGALSAPQPPAGNPSASSSSASQGYVGPDSKHDTVGPQPGFSDHPCAGNASDAPPPYVDDGSRPAHAGDAKYA